VIALAIAAGLVVTGIAGFFGYQTFKSYQFPPGYRNRPATGWNTRPGEDEFSAADDQIKSFAGTNAFGNNPAAIRLAHEYAETLKATREKLFTKGSKIEILESTKGEFLTYCELHDRECAFIVHAPELRRYEKDFTEKVDARKLLSQAAWISAQVVMKRGHQGKQGMELAVGVRGISQYGPIMIGYYKEEMAQPEDGIIKNFDDGSLTHFLWPFFAKPVVSESNSPALRTTN
jgi:hypothetical protein